MKVTTVRLPDDLAEAVAEAAEDTERSQSEYIRHVLRTHFDSKPNTAGGEAVERRLAELEARVEALEAGGAIAPAPLATDTPEADVEPSDAVVEALEASGWAYGRGREERRRNAAVAAWALEVLREADRECRRADVPLDALDDDRKPKTVWLEVVRPAILAVAEATGAVEVGESGQRYRWVGG